MSHVILLALAPVFFVMGLGYFAGRRRIVDNKQVAGLNTFVMSFAVPASAFVAIASAPRAQMLAQGWLFAIQGAVMVAVYLLWFLWQTRLLGVSRSESATQALTIAFPNIAGAALPLANVILGPEGAVPVAIAIAAGSMLVTPLTLILLAIDDKKDATGGHAKRSPILASLRQALLRPLVIAPLLGIAVSLSGLPVDPVIANSFRLIGQTAAGAALFLTGLVLSAQALRMDWTIAVATAVGDILRPLLAYALVRALPVPPETARVAVLLAAVPSGFFGILLGLGHGLGAKETGPMVILSTIVSAATLATAIAMLFPR